MAVAFLINCLFLLLFGFVKPTVLPVEKCVLSDSKCMTAAFQKAIPAYMGGLPKAGVEVLDPLHLDDIAFDISGLQFGLKEGILKGLKTSVIDKVKWDLKKKRISVDYHMNGLTRGKYKANGKIFVLPITGDGIINIVFKNIYIFMNVDYKSEKGPNGKEYAVPTKFDYTFDVKDYAHFNLTNLFGGDKTLSGGMHQFLNTNWKAVSVEFGKPLMDGAARKIFKSVVNFFKNEPLSDIAHVQ